MHHLMNVMVASHGQNICRPAAPAAFYSLELLKPGSRWVGNFDRTTLLEDQVSLMHVGSKGWPGWSRSNRQADWSSNS